MIVVPAILESDPQAVQTKLDIVKADRDKKRVHIDIIDGNLAPQLTVTPADLALLDFGQLQIDWHLMTEDPLDYVWEIFCQQPSLPSAAIFAQLERCSDPVSLLREVKERHLEAGIALDLYTETAALEDFSWEFLDSVLFLAVPMGQSGQVFQEQVWQKIEQLRQLSLAQGKLVNIYLDGGLKLPQLKRLEQLADIHAAVVGSYYFATHINNKPY